MFRNSWWPDMVVLLAALKSSLWGRSIVSHHKIKSNVPYLRLKWAICCFLVFFFPEKLSFYNKI